MQTASKTYIFNLTQHFSTLWFLILWCPTGTFKEAKGWLASLFRLFSERKGALLQVKSEKEKYSHSPNHL